MRNIAHVREEIVAEDTMKVTGIVHYLDDLSSTLSEVRHFSMYTCNLHCLCKSYYFVDVYIIFYS